MSPDQGERPARHLWAGLRDLISEHKPSDHAERWALSEISLSLDGGEAKLSKSAPGSHFTVSCLCLDARMTRALMIHHRKLGRVLQPGGHIEPADASFQAAAMREVAEETLPPGSPPPTLMLDGALLDVDAHDIPASASTPAHRHLDLRFLARMPEGHEPWHNPIEATGALWVPLAELAASPDPSISRMARKALEIVAARPRLPAP